MDDLDAQLPHSKLIAAATFITAAREYPHDRNGGVAKLFVTSCCSLLTLNSFEISSLLLLSAEASSVILEYLLFIMVEHLFASAETIGLSFLPAEKAVGLMMILVDDDKANAPAAPR